MAGTDGALGVVSDRVVSELICPHDNPTAWVLLPMSKPGNRRRKVEGLNLLSLPSRPYHVLLVYVSMRKLWLRSQSLNYSLSTMLSVVLVFEIGLVFVLF